MIQNKSIQGFVHGFQPEIIRSNQKDEEYQLQTYQKLLKGIEIFIPHVISYRTISKFKNELKLCASMLYFGFTSLSNIKTFGEEFTGIIQINRSEFFAKGILSSRKNKILFFVLTTVFQYILRKKTEKPFNNYQEKCQAEPLEHRSYLHSLLRNLPNFSGIVDKFFQVNLTIFFIQGLFLQASKRLAKIEYVFTKSAPKHNIVYDKVGKLVLGQLIIQFLRFLYHVYQDQKRIKKILRQQYMQDIEQQQEEDRNFSLNQNQMNKQNVQLNNKKNSSDYGDEEEEEDELDQSETCGVCFDRRQYSTATPCGHLFCWECVLKYVNLKQECPSCRAKCLPQKLVQLRNYS